MRHRRFMWAEALELLDRAERLQRQFFQTTESKAGPVWEPPVDLFETEAGLTFLIALPGVPPDQIEVQVERGQLWVVGNRPWPEALRRSTIRRLEIPHGRFERRLELPPGLYELANQEVAHGCLAVHLRRLG
ncbi:MAG: Hsp20/alpha crystallin family protein [Sulfurifustaceae bacterium]